MRIFFRVVFNVALACGVMFLYTESNQWDDAIAAPKKSGSKKYKKRRKKRKRSTHSHAHHGHSHAGHSHRGHRHATKRAHTHHVHTGFTLSAGFSLTQSMGGQGSSSEAAGASGEEDHSGHDHALAGFGLVDEHEGHDHGSEGSESSSESTGGPGYSLSLSPGYRVSSMWAVNSSFSYGKSGLIDPSAGLSNTLKINSATHYVTSLTATVPLSDSSSTSGKLTTVTVKTGPTYTTGRWNMGVNAMFGYSMFSAEQQMEEDHDDHDEEFALTEDDHEHEEEELEYEDRESMKFGGDVGLGYRVMKGVKASGGGDLTIASSANGIVMYHLNVKLMQVAYTLGKWNTAGWLSVSGSQVDSIAMPSSPSVGASMMYSL